jgi:hypothetical protein
MLPSWPGKVNAGFFKRTFVKAIMAWFLSSGVFALVSKRAWTAAARGEFIDFL